MEQIMLTGGENMLRKVLLVDDEVAFLLPMKKMLGGSRLQVDTAETFEQAVGLLNAGSYDAVIADVRLGGALSREGLAILDLVRTRGMDTRVIIMTGFGGPDVMKDAYQLRADCYFEKPVSFRTLSEALGRLGVLDHDHLC
jgi:DNA-binding NtrC family response regulator